MDQRIIVEMGMGNDQYGGDWTKAAKRAIEDAIRHSSLPLFEATGLNHDAMRVQVTVGVGGDVDLEALAKGLPRGRVEVKAVSGGLAVTNPDSGNVTVIASAAVEAFLPAQDGWRLKG